MLVFQEADRKGMDHNIPVSEITYGQPILPDIENQGSDIPRGIILSPGFTERHELPDLIKHAKSVVGEYKCNVTLKDVTVSGKVNVSTKEYHTVGSAVAGIFKQAMCFKNRTDRKVLLNDISTAFGPGRITLLLGPPQSGKSTLLRYIASRLDHSLKDGSQGELRFNNVVVPAAEIPRIVSYVPQYDEHNPVLTVEQTLNFAHDCMSTDFHNYLVKNDHMIVESGEGAFRPKVEVVMHGMGLKNCKDTILGSESLRGVSGGERKRVTSAEMIVGVSMVLCMDEISTGLDAAATSDIIKALKNQCHDLQMTVIIALLQPPPDVIAIFDDIAVLGNGGNLVYHGPVSKAEDYFTKTLGFTRPSNIDLGDFLVDVCTDDAKIYYLHDAPPPSCLEMAERWKRSDLCKEHMEPVFEVAEELELHEHNNVNKEPFTSMYGASYGKLFMLNLKRHLQILRSDPLIVRQKISTAIFQGTMLGWIYWQTSNSLQLVGLLFMLIAMMSAGNLAVIDVTAAKRGVFYKQRDANFYPTWTYIVSETLSDVPVQLAETILVGTLIYFLAGFQPSEFGVFFVTLFLAAVLFVSIFKAITAHTSTASAAQGVAMGVVAFSFCFSGFLVTHSSLPDYFVWIYWLMPFSWLLRLLALNEFLSSKYDAMIPCGSTASVQQMLAAAQSSTQASWNAAWEGGHYDASHVCGCKDHAVATVMTNSGLGNFGDLGWPNGYKYAACRLGYIYLDAFSIQTDRGWIGYGFAYCIGMILFMLLVYYLGMEYRRLGTEPPTIAYKPRTVVRRNRTAISKEFEALPDPPTLAAKSTGIARGQGTLGSQQIEQAMELPTTEPKGRKITRRQRTAGSVEFDVAESAADAAFVTLKALSVQPPEVTLVLKDVSYSVPVPEKDERDRPTGKTTEKMLLNNVSAVFRPGTMTALMGSSGAGKTTLMDVIAGRKTAGAITGEILVNGHSQDLRTFSRISGYVEQNDLHVPSATVLEALRFSAFQRLPRELSDKEKELAVQAVIDLIELRPILHKAIGKSGAKTGGLSVEQKKRVTIGVEMVANPAVLFLDEPTSGLDSRSARIVMRAIRRIAATGRTVVCTIHQPSFEIFSMFDELLLLKKGGWMVYCGGLGPSRVSEVTREPYNTARDMISYFESSSPDAPRYVEGQNPAEYMLEIIGAGTKAGNNGGRGEGGVDFAECFRSSTMAKSIEDAIASLQIGEKLKFDQVYAAPYWRQYLMSTERWLQIYWRDVAYNLTRLLIGIGIVLLFGFNMFRKEATDMASLTSFNGALFSVAFFTAAIQGVMTVAVLGDQKVVYYRELDSKTYSPGAYLFGLTIAEIPWILLVTFLHVVIYYPLAGLWVAPEAIAQYAVSLFVFSTMFNYYGQMLAAVLPTTEAASLLCGVTVGLFNIYSGFFLSVNDFPWPWRILFYICPARFGLKAIMPAQFWCSRSCIDDIACNGPAMASAVCSPTDAGCSRPSLAAVGADGPGCRLMVDVGNQIALKSGANSHAKWLTEAGFGSAPTVTVWDYWSVTTETTYEERWSNVAIMIAFLVAFRLATFYYLKYVKHIKR